MANPLQQVEKGQKVVDSAGQEIGTVERVHLSDEDPSTPDVQTVAAPDTPERTSPVDLLADIFRVDGIPDVLQKRLRREGFVRMDADGLFASDRYVLPDQIKSVSDGQVFLNTDRDALIKQ